MIDPTVRRAGPGDAGPLQVLEAEARAALIDARGGERWLQVHPLIGSGWVEATRPRDVFAARPGVRGGGEAAERRGDEQHGRRPGADALAAARPTHEGARARGVATHPRVPHGRGS